MLHATKTLAVSSANVLGKQAGASVLLSRRLCLTLVGDGVPYRWGESVALYRWLMRHQADARGLAGAGSTGRGTIR